MNIRKLTYYIQSANINFLIGSRASIYVELNRKIIHSVKRQYGFPL